MSPWKRVVLASLSLLVLVLAPAGAALAQIKVTAATPSSAYQGTLAMDVVVYGSGFDATAKVQYLVSGTTSTGGITVRKVTYRSSQELVTTIDVATNANLASFDIAVVLTNGRRGKGTTLFKVESKPNQPPPQEPLPTYPAARAWHGFTSNGGTDAASSRLYMYGGAGSDWQTVPAHLWYYGALANEWKLVVPSGTTQPGSLQHEGLSCQLGTCVLFGGSNGFSLVGDTWVYRESTNAWTKVTCSRTAPCPSARQMPTVAFDSVRGSHLLFGGRGSSGLSDTWTFDAAALKWTSRAPTVKPAERNRAAALHVPGIGVVMHGGQNYVGSAVRCDMYAWNGSNWTAVAFDAGQPHPCLHSHDAWWDGQSLVVTGGYVDTSDTPSSINWRFTFSADGRSGVWSRPAFGTCLPVLGADAVIHPGARMAYDVPTATRVYFGGEVNTAQGVVRYGNTVECY